jgi:hypothetical protein
MASLRETMARHGFESNDDYEFQVRCLLGADTSGIRCLNILGDSDRRKTAFANALAHALDYPTILYHDFTQQNPPRMDVILPPSRDKMGREEPPVDPLDQIVSEACALSEGERTLLILDQLQAADFREHIRLFRFVESARWSFRDAAYFANPQRLTLFLISEKPLYHSLQRLSFRVWVDRISERQIRYQAEEFGLGIEVQAVMNALAELFAGLGTVPTRSEYRRILHDVRHHVRTADELRHCIFGWTEGVERARLFDPTLDALVQGAMRAIETYVGVDEVEIGGCVSDQEESNQPDQC